MSSNSSGTADTSISQTNIIQACYLILIIIISFWGNLAVIVGIVREHLLDNVTNCFILNLAISDLLNAALKMTTTVASLLERNWYPSNVICYLTTPFGVLFGAASVLSLTSVAVARYLTITMPFTYANKVTPSVAKFVLGGVWLGSILLAFPPVTWRPTEVICHSGAVSDKYYTYELVYIIFLWLFVIVLPYAVMLISYKRIFGVTRYQIRRISVTGPAAAVDDRRTLRRRLEVRAAIVLALIGGVFILCWLPFFIILTMHKFALAAIDTMYFKIFLCWMYTNSALNPMLLVLFNKEIRAAVQGVLPCSYRVDTEHNSSTTGFS